MPGTPTSVAYRPGTPAGYSAGYAGGFDVYANAGPNDGVPVVTLWAQARPSACLLGPGISAVLGQLNTYYGGGKAATVIGSNNVGPINAAGADGSVPWVTVRDGLIGYQVLAADLVAQSAALVALLAGGNVNKGGNP